MQRASSCLNYFAFSATGKTLTNAKPPSAVPARRNASKRATWLHLSAPGTQSERERVQSVKRLEQMRMNCLTEVPAAGTSSLPLHPDRVVHVAGQAAKTVRKHLAKAARAHRHALSLVKVPPRQAATVMTNSEESMTNPLSPTPENAFRVDQIWAAVIQNHFRLTLGTLCTPFGNFNALPDLLLVLSMCVRFNVVSATRVLHHGGVTAGALNASVVEPTARECVTVQLLEYWKQIQKVQDSDLERLWTTFAEPFLYHCCTPQLSHVATEGAAADSIPPLPLKVLMFYLPLDTLSAGETDRVRDFIRCKLSSGTAVRYGSADEEEQLRFSLVTVNSSEQISVLRASPASAASLPIAAPSAEAVEETTHASTAVEPPEDTNGYAARLEECKSLLLLQSKHNKLHSFIQLSIRAIFRDLLPSIGDHQLGGVSLEALERRARWGRYERQLGPLATFVDFYNGLFFDVTRSFDVSNAEREGDVVRRVGKFKGHVGPWLLYGRLLLRLFPSSVPLPLFFVAETLSWGVYFRHCGALPSVYEAVGRIVVRGTLLPMCPRIPPGCAGVGEEESEVPAHPQDGSTAEMIRDAAALRVWVETCVFPLLRGQGKYATSLSDLEELLGPWWRDSPPLTVALVRHPAQFTLCDLLTAYTSTGTASSVAATGTSSSSSSSSTHEETAAVDQPAYCLSLDTSTGMVTPNPKFGLGAPDALALAMGLCWNSSGDPALRPKLPPISLTEWVAQNEDISHLRGRRDPPPSFDPVEAFFLTEAGDVLVWDSESDDQ